MLSIRCPIWNVDLDKSPASPYRQEDWDKFNCPFPKHSLPKSRPGKDSTGRMRRATVLSHAFGTTTSSALDAELGRKSTRRWHSMCHHLEIGLFQEPTASLALRKAQDACSRGRCASSHLRSPA